MVKSKTVNIKELKSNLRAYLKEVGSGTRVLVSDRSKIVAEINEPMIVNLRQAAHPKLAEWVNSGAVLLPTARKTSIGLSPVKMKRTSPEILKQIRKDSRE